MSRVEVNFFLVNFQGRRYTVHSDWRKWGLAFDGCDNYYQHEMDAFMKYQNHIFSAILTGQNKKEVQQLCIKCNCSPTSNKLQSYLFDEFSYSDLDGQNTYKENHKTFIEGLFKGALVQT